MFYIEKKIVLIVGNVGYLNICFHMQSQGVCGHESWRSRCCSKCSSLVTTSSLTDKSSSSPNSPTPLPTGSPSYLDVSIPNIIQVGCFNYRVATSGCMVYLVLEDNCIRHLISLFNFLLLSFWKRKDKKTSISL